MPFVFKVTSQDEGKLSLEAQHPSTPYTDTLITHLTPKTDISEALQLELELFPLVEGETINYSQGASIRVIPLAPAPAPEPKFKGVKL
jgi:hypothetical protein